MNQPRSKDPLHGITLEQILTRLVDHYGWDELGMMITIRCFTHDPSIKSSLKFLRKTPWARTKVEQLFIRTRFKDEPAAPAPASAPATSSEAPPPSAATPPSASSAK